MLNKRKNELQQQEQIASVTVTPSANAHNTELLLLLFWLWLLLKFRGPVKHDMQLNFCRSEHRRKLISSWVNIRLTLSTFLEQNVRPLTPQTPSFWRSSDDIQFGNENDVLFAMTAMTWKCWGRKRKAMKMVRFCQVKHFICALAQYSCLGLVVYAKVVKMIGLYLITFSEDFSLHWF